MLIMALVLISLLYWPSSAAASNTMPTVDTVSSINNNAAILYAAIIASGGSIITEYGFYYGTATAPFTKVRSVRLLIKIPGSAMR